MSTDIDGTHWFVNKVLRNGTTGIAFALTAADASSRKVDGEYVPGKRLYFEVRPGWDDQNKTWLNINFDAFKENDVIDVIGRVVAEEYTKKDGTTADKNVVRAQTIQLHTPKGRTQETFTPAIDADEPF